MAADHHAGDVPLAAFVLGQDVAQSESQYNADEAASRHEVERRASLDFFHGLDAESQERLETERGALYSNLGCPDQTCRAPRRATQELFDHQRPLDSWQSAVARLAVGELQLYGAGGKAAFGRGQADLQTSAAAGQLGRACGRLDLGVGVE